MERTLKKINMIMGYMFQNAERFNREVTALAAFRLEYNRSKDYAKAMRAANDTVVETQGDFDRWMAEQKTWLQKQATEAPTAPIAQNLSVKN